MIKIAMIGAGSVVFSKNLTCDILSYPDLKNASISYMDIDKQRLELGVNLCRKAAQALGANPKIQGTLDRRQALKGADFVINTVQIGGFNSTLVDFEIPRRYGLNFTIADTTGPGGLFRALRTYPLLASLCQNIEDLCPKAFLLNYSNPMSMNMQTITRTSSVKAVGLCHSVQGTFSQLMRYLGENPEGVSFICAGINHMAFYLKIEKNGVDLYPRLFKAMEDPAVYKTNKVRFELMKRLGYYVTESSEHNAEYNPYFIPRGRETIERFDVPIDEYLRRCDRNVDEFERMSRVLKSNEPLKVNKSREYGSIIINSIVTGSPSVVYGNMPNAGTITNLPETAIVEATTLVHRAGLQHAAIGELPPQVVGYIQPHVTQHELFIRAALEGRRDYLYQAAMFDPLTAATLSLDNIVEMCDELILAHGKLLPKLTAKTLVPGSGKKFKALNPKDLRHSWDAAQAKMAEHCLREWQIIGPFKNPVQGKISLDFKTPIEANLLNGKGGAVDLKADYADAGQVLKWNPCQADKKGFVNFGAAFGRIGWSVGYAYAVFESVHPREALLHCGSKDGIRVWLNGKVVHSHEVQRGHSHNSDEVPVFLKEGVNHLVVKIDNTVGQWGFSLGIPPANF